MKIRLRDRSGTIDLKYLVEDVDRYGIIRVYFRRKGQFKVRLEAEVGSEAFLQEYRAALAGTPIESKPVEPPRRLPAAPGSLRWLIQAYYQSAEFKLLDGSTQHARRLILDGLCEEPISDDNPASIGSLPYASMPTSKVRALRDRKATLPEAANSRVKALRQVFTFALAAEIPLVDRNPARDVPYIKTGSQGHHTWTVEEVRQFEERHPMGTKARLALALFLFTGVRRSDCVVFGKQHVRKQHHDPQQSGIRHGGRWLTFTQQKNRKRKPVTLSIPILPELEEVIEASPCGDLTFLVTAFNKPFTSNGFGNKFRDWCNQARLPHCSAHGLRKAGATIAAENGATEHQLMAIFGWATSKQAGIYTRAARQKVLAASGMGLLVPGRNQNESVQLEEEVDGSWTKSAGK